MLADNKNLTLGEKMRLLRSRLSENQESLARAFGVSKYQYRKVECGGEVLPALHTKIVDFVDTHWDRPAGAHELLRIERERAGFHTVYAAEVVGYSRSLWMIIEGGGRPHSYAPKFQQKIYNHATIIRKSSKG